MRNHYAMLGVLPAASLEEIRASYRQLVKRFHPDMPGGNARFFARIQEAYEILSEPRLRNSYDRNPRATPDRQPPPQKARAWSAGSRQHPFSRASRKAGAQQAGAQQTGSRKAGSRQGAENLRGRRNGHGQTEGGTRTRGGATNPGAQGTPRGNGTGTRQDQRAGFATGIREAIRSKAGKNKTPMAMLTRIMSIAVPRSGRFQLQGLIGNIEVQATTPETLWPSTLKKFGDKNPEHLARHIIQIKLSGERDLVRTMMPRPTDFGVEFQRDAPDIQKTKLRTFIENLMSNGPLGGLFTRSPFGLYGAYLPLTLHITVPKGLPLYLRDITGTIVLGNLDSDITAKVLGGIIKAGRVRNINLTLNGGSRAFIRELRGNADLMGFGTSRIYLGGRVGRMRAVLDNRARAEINAPITSLLTEINGQAVLDARAPVAQAYLTVEDQGHIRLASVTSHLETHCGSQGRIEILHQRRNLAAGG